MPFISPENQQSRISDKIEAAIAAVRDGKTDPRGYCGPDLYGQAVDYVCEREISNRYSLKLIADSVQGFGTQINSKHPSGWADAAIFLPAEPFGR